MNMARASVMGLIVGIVTLALVPAPAAAHDHLYVAAVDNVVVLSAAELQGQASVLVDVADSAFSLVGFVYCQDAAGCGESGTPACDFLTLIEGTNWDPALPVVIELDRPTGTNHCSTLVGFATVGTVSHS